METIRGVFDAPRDCTKEQLRQYFNEAGHKFLDHFEREGWILRTPLDFYADFGKSKEDPNKIHYVIVGKFTPDNKKEEREQELVLPAKIVDKLIKRFGRRIKVNE